MNKILYHPKKGTTGFFIGSFPDENTYKTLNRNTHLYLKALALAKQEAINNGEIVNPEILPQYELHKIGGRLMADGDTFDLPDGVMVKEIEIETVEDGGGCFVTGNKKAIRLVKEEKEQPKQGIQEELWAEVINDARWYDGSPQDLINMTTFLKRKFTIQREQNETAKNT